MAQYFARTQQVVVRPGALRNELSYDWSFENWGHDDALGRPRGVFHYKCDDVSDAVVRRHREVFELKNDKYQGKNRDRPGRDACPAGAQWQQRQHLRPTGEGGY